MNKFITTIALVAVASAALSTAASAGPGNGNQNQQIGQQGGGFQPQINLGGFKLKTGGGYVGGDSTSPGDAFYPDRGSVGDPKLACIADGGTPVRRLIDADFYWVCI